MNTPGLGYEIAGHALVIGALIAVVLYVGARRRLLRRTLRRGRILYWLILAIGGGSLAINGGQLVAMLAVGASSPFPFLDLAAEYISMVSLSVVIILLISLRIISERRAAGPRRILVIGAHPDDIEIACGAAVAKFHDAGAFTAGMVMTRGEQGGDSSVRPAEALSGAAFLGLDRVKLLTLPDTKLQEHGQELIRFIEEAIREYKPDVILTHSSHDLHQDHTAVHAATLRAARAHSSILCYESPSATPEFNPTVFVDVDDYIDVKIESIREHWDQHNKPYMHPERVKGVAVFRGGQAKVRYAEAFEVVRATLLKAG